MTEFKTQKEYDDWRADHALKRQRAKDLEKHDAEHPVYIADTPGKNIGPGSILILACIGLVFTLSFTASGRAFLVRLAASLRQILGL